MKILKLESLFLFFSSLHFSSLILFHSFSCSVIMGLDGERERERDKYEHEHKHRDTKLQSIISTLRRYVLDYIYFIMSYYI